MQGTKKFTKATSKVITQEQKDALKEQKRLERNAQHRSQYENTKMRLKQERKAKKLTEKREECRKRDIPLVYAPYIEFNPTNYTLRFKTMVQLLKFTEEFLVESPNMNRDNLNNLMIKHVAMESKIAKTKTPKPEKEDDKDKNDEDDE